MGLVGRSGLRAVPTFPQVFVLLAVAGFGGAAMLVVVSFGWLAAAAAPSAAGMERALRVPSVGRRLLAGLAVLLAVGGLALVLTTDEDGQLIFGAGGASALVFAAVVSITGRWNRACLAESRFLVRTDSLAS